MKNQVKSRNGHIWKRVGRGPDTYFMVDNDRFENYYESVHEFRRRANPRKYQKQETHLKS